MIIGVFIRNLKICQVKYNFNKLRRKHINMKLKKFLPMKHEITKLQK